MFNMPSDIGLSVIRKVTDLWAASKSDSLIDYTAPSRVEPIALIDADCMYHDMLPDVMQSLQSIFAGYYLQAMAISMNVGKVEVMRHLDKLNPQRNVLNSGADTAGWLMTMESYKHRLPRYSDPRIVADYNYAMEASGTISNISKVNKYQDEEFELKKKTYELGEKNFEQNTDKFEYQVQKDQLDAMAASLREGREQRKEERDNATFDFNAMKYYADRDMKDRDFNQHVKEVQDKFEMDKKKMGFDEAFKNAQLELQKRGLALQEKQYQDSLTKSEFGIGRDTMGTIKELTNLSVGKLISVEVTDGNNRATIPVSIRLMASSIPSDNIVNILSAGKKDTSTKERYHAWKSGRLEFIRDMVLCQDLIEAHKKNIMADKSGMYAEILKRRRGNQLSTLFSGNPSVATASNLLVCSKTTIETLEGETGYAFNEFRAREKIFDETYLMIVAVIDKMHDRVTFYHRGINTATQLGLRDLRASNKNTGPDVGEILKAYQLGSAPSL